MLKLLIISVTHHTPQHRVSDTMTHVTVNTIKMLVGNMVLNNKFQGIALLNNQVQSRLLMDFVTPIYKHVI
jgi:hypothetical protein